MKQRAHQTTLNVLLHYLVKYIASDLFAPSCRTCFSCSSVVVKFYHTFRMFKKGRNETHGRTVPQNGSWYFSCDLKKHFLILVIVWQKLAVKLWFIFPPYLINASASALPDEIGNTEIASLLKCCMCITKKHKALIYSLFAASWTVITVRYYASTVLAVCMCLCLSVTCFCHMVWHEVFLRPNLAAL